MTALISELQPIHFTMRDGSLTPMGEGRLAGIHMSEVVREMKAAAGENVGSIPGEDPEVRPQAGFWWEAALAWAMGQHLAADGLVGPDVIWQPQLTLEGRPITPDGFEPHKGGRLLSVKFTWKTMRKWEEDAEAHFWSWFVHDMAAMKALSDEGYRGRQYVVYTVRYFIFWAMGDYSRKPGRGAQPTWCDVTFTDEAIEASWKTARRYFEYLERRREKEARP